MNDTDKKHLIELLKFGDEITLPELADALNKQASMEARLGFEYNETKRQYDHWEKKLLVFIIHKMPGVARATPELQKMQIAQANDCLKEYLYLRKHVSELSHRLADQEVAYKATETRGKMLQSIRNVVQGPNGPGIIGSLKTGG